jgi:hypothetical protein
MTNKRCETNTRRLSATRARKLKSILSLFADFRWYSRLRDNPAARNLHTENRISLERAQTSIHASSGVRILKSCVVKTVASPQWLGIPLLSCDIARKYSTRFLPPPVKCSIILALSIPCSRNSLSIRRVQTMSKHQLHCPPKTFPKTSATEWVIQSGSAPYKLLRSRPEETNLNNLFLMKCLSNTSSAGAR